MTGWRCHSRGESRALTAIVEGLPAGLELSAEQINRHLARRQRGFGRGERMKLEQDRVRFLSGLRFNRTLGSPLTLQICNRDWENWSRVMAPEGERPAEAAALTCPRPGHADLAGAMKYGERDLRPILERASARETALRVAVGSVARVLLEHFGFAFYSRVLSIGPVKAAEEDEGWIDRYRQVEDSPVRCSDPRAEAAMMEAIREARERGDTLGGVFEVVVTGVIPNREACTGRRWTAGWPGPMTSRRSGAGDRHRICRGRDRFPGPVPGLPVRQRGGAPFQSRRGPDRNHQRPAQCPGVTAAADTEQAPASVDLRDGSQRRPGAPDVCAVPAAAVVAGVIAWELACFREKFPGDYPPSWSGGAFHRRQVGRFAATAINTEAR